MDNQSNIEVPLSGSILSSKPSEASSLRVESEQGITIKPTATDSVVTAIIQNASGVGIGIILSFFGIYLITKALLSSSNIGSMINSATSIVTNLAQSIRELTEADKHLMEAMKSHNKANAQRLDHLDGRLHDIGLKVEHILKILKSYKND